MPAPSLSRLPGDPCPAEIAAIAAQIRRENMLRLAPGTRPAPTLAEREVRAYRRATRRATRRGGRRHGV